MTCCHNFAAATLLDVKWTDTPLGMAGSLVAVLAAARPALGRTRVACAGARVPQGIRGVHGGCGSGGMPRLPPNVIKTSQMPNEGTYHANSFPKGWLKAHSIKRDTWGVIRVTKGALRYQINEPEPRTFELNVIIFPKVGVIEPTVRHALKPLTEDVEFVVEFYRVPAKKRKRRAAADRTRPSARAQSPKEASRSDRVYT